VIPLRGLSAAQPRVRIVAPVSVVRRPRLLDDASVVPERKAWRRASVLTGRSTLDEAKAKFRNNWTKAKAVGET